MDKRPPPDGDTNVGAKALGILLAVFALCLLFYVSRIYTHLVPKSRLKAPDFVISLAIVSL